MRIASIDCGSNTFFLLIADFDGEKLYPVFQQAEIVGLARNSATNGALAPDAQQRAIDTLTQFNNHIQKFNCEHVFACGTSALRNAANKSEFLQHAETSTGINIEIISEEDEAIFGFIGVAQDVENEEQPLILVDIGGGSTELCWGKKHDLGGHVSLPLGAIRLTEKFVHSDPISPEDLTAMWQEIQSKLDLIPAISLPSQPRIVGVAATPITFAAMEIAKSTPEFSIDDLSGFELSFEQLTNTVEKVIRLSIAERKKLPGLHESRADVILAGGLILTSIMRKLPMESLDISLSGLRFGYALIRLHELKQVKK